MRLKPRFTLKPSRACTTVWQRLARQGLCLLALGVSAWPALAQPAAWKGLTLQDHRQQTVTAATLAGKPVLMNFVFAGCTSVCPVQVQELLQVHGALSPDVQKRLQFVSVTVDPLSDSPAVLARFAQRQNADRSGWRFVSGAPKEVFRLLDRMQAFDPAQRKPQAADHRSSLYLFAADGRLLQRFRGTPVDRTRLTDELTRLALQAPTL